MVIKEIVRFESSRNILRGKREKKMTEHPLYQIMHPKSVAIIGASNDVTKMGTIQLLNLLAGKYPGKIYPIHPQEETVLGLKAYHNARELPELADLAILTLPTSAVPEVLQDLGGRGVKRAIIISGGFREAGEQGKALEEQVVAIARKLAVLLHRLWVTGEIFEPLRLATRKEQLVSVA